MSNWEQERDAWEPFVTVPVPDLWPAALRQVQREAANAGWLTMITGGEDSRGHRYLTLDGLSRDRERAVRVTWHSRPTDGRSLRLFSSMLREPYRGWCHLTLKKLIERIRSSRQPRSVGTGAVAVQGGVP